jgi:hypothetical protein
MSLFGFLKYKRYPLHLMWPDWPQAHTLPSPPPEEKFPQRYFVSLHVNIFSNLLPNSPLPKINQAISQSQPSFSQTRSVEPTQLWNSYLITVPNTQPHLSHTCPLQQKISQTFVPSPSTSTLNELSSIPSTTKTMTTPTCTSPAPLSPQQPHMLPTSQYQPLITSQPQHLLGLNQETFIPPNLNQPSLSIILPFNKVDPLSLTSTSACTFTQTATTNPTKLSYKKSSNTSRKDNPPKNHSLSTPSVENSENYSSWF